MDRLPTRCVLIGGIGRAPRESARIASADDEDHARVDAGAAAFRSIGRCSCHVPDLGGVEGFSSDPLLHDMGPRLVDTGTSIAFSARPAPPAPAPAPADETEWRTPPLWVLRDSAPYLHDGRAATISEAILLHDGQGSPASRRFAQLHDRRKEQLAALLLSLAAPPEEIAGPEGIGAD
ncbi:di-heme oxidoredictase family protein [Tautonia sociabilis]|uniref:Uncharacterized protein n=1 Tax=Tautonia sociabilis TaxID=2080755 RepID=A0A432MG19_9BACT|nr:di-heme oxidoredictase family protein [Tautonia sociabilis]RUL85262.1 hypothetical protein TsocGM_18810 [Tautonia sociabilis]